MKVSGVAVSKSFLLRLLATNLPLLLLIHWFLIHYRIFLFKALQNVLPKVLKLHSKLGGEGGGWSGGAKVLGKLPVPGRPTNLDKSRARAYCVCSRCGWGCLDIFLSSIISLFFLPQRRPNVD